MRHRLSLITITLALAATPATAVASTWTSPLKFTTPGTGVSCVMASTSVSCQGATSAVTLSATVIPDGLVTSCRQSQGASPGCLLWPGASYQDGFTQQPEPRVGPFACIPIGLPFQAKGAVCTVVSSGKGFRITAAKVARVDQIPAGPHPPCTRAALTRALERAFHKRSLAPSYLSGGWQCAGNYARGVYVDAHGPGTADDVAVVFRGSGRGWELRGRGKTCEDGELPAKIYVVCTVD